MGSKRLAHLLALFGIAERPCVVKATTGINNIPTKAWMVRSECICSSVAPSTASSTSSTAATAVVRCLFPALPPDHDRFADAIVGSKQNKPKKL